MIRTVRLRLTDAAPPEACLMPGSGAEELEDNLGESGTDMMMERGSDLEST